MQGVGIAWERKERGTMKKSLEDMSRWELLDVLGDRVSYCSRDVILKLAYIAIDAVPDGAPAPYLSTEEEQEAAASGILYAK